jgi:PPOX class probable F420-dependent enzyme
VTAVLPPDVRAFLEAMKVPGVLATIGRKGGPVASSVWFALEGDTIIVSTPVDRTKARNARADGRVSFLVDTRERPYSGVAIEGEAEVVEDPEGLLGLAIAQRYLGDDLPERITAREPGSRAIIRIRPLRVRPWNLA